jgi:hypothetical protein
MFAVRFQPVSFLVLITMLLTFSACGGGSSSQPSFTGVNQTYVVAGGERELELKGRSGTYTATTQGGTQALPVSLGPTDISVGGRGFPYFRKGNLLTGGGYIGFASDSVASDPKAAAGTYTTMTGVNFAGQLSIDTSGNYVWCMRSVISGATCADGSIPKSGSTSVQQKGFKFAGILGTYAIYHHDSGAAIFPIDSQSLRLMALTQPSGPPKGSFMQPSSEAKGNPPLLRIRFERNGVAVSGDPAWNGDYSYTASGGVVSFSSDQCPNGSCNAIYSNDLGIFYIPRLGNAFFIR